MIHSFIAFLVRGPLLGQKGIQRDLEAPYFHSTDATNLHISSYFLTFRAIAVEGVDLVDALAVVEARLTGAFICVDVAEDALIS